MNILPSLFWIFILAAPVFAQKPQPHPLSRFVWQDTISLEYYKNLGGPLFEGARELYRDGEYRKAAEAFLKLYENTKDPASLLLAGNCYYNLDETDEAIRYYTRAIEQGLERMPDVHSNLATAYYLKSRSADAIREFKRVLELTGGKDPMAHYGLGILFDGAGQHDLAIAHYKKTVELTGDSEPLARQHLGVSYFMKGDYLNAVRELEIYLRQVPDDPGGNLNLAIALRYAGQLDRAIRELHAAIARSGDHIPSAHYQLGRIYAERKQYGLSLRHFEIAIARGLRSPKIEAEFEAVKKEASAKIP